MRFRYDPTSGALYFRVREGEIEETAELPTPGSYVDVDSGGRVMGLEFLSVHEFLAFLVASGGEAEIPERLDPEARDIGRLLRGRRAGESQEGEEGSTYQQVVDSVFQATLQAHNVVEQAAEAAQNVAEGVGQVEQGRSEGVGEEERPLATESASQRAEELGVDLSEVEGTGSGGLITVRDVMQSRHRD